MKICFINPTKKLRVGVKELVIRLEERGHEIVIFHPRGNVRVGNAEIIKINSLFIPKIRYTIPNFFQHFLKLLRLSNNGLDVIHVWETYPTAIAPVLIKKTRKIPIVVTEDGFPGISWFYGSKFVDIPAGIYTRSIGRFIFSSADKVTLLYRGLMEDAARLGIARRKIEIIPNGVDTGKFRNLEGGSIRNELKIRDDEIMILFIGRLVPVKGIDILIEISKRLLRKNYKIKTVIVGDGPYMNEYKRIASTLGDKIVFTGFRRDIPELLSACDIFVFPSRYEGLPAVILEASSCAKPIVSSNLPGVSEIIKNGKNGLLSDSGDADGFADQIETLINGPSLRNRLGRSARRFVKTEYEWDRVIGKYERIYSDLV